MFKWRGDGTLKGFAAFSLSKFNVSDFTSDTRPDGNFKPEDGICYYRDFRGDQAQVNDWFLVVGDWGPGPGVSIFLVGDKGWFISYSLINGCFEPFETYSDLRTVCMGFGLFCTE